MLETTRVTDDLTRAREHARRVGLADQLKEQLDFLGNYQDPERTRCILQPDFAPYSFTFTMQRLVKGGQWRPWFTGGLIYHGPHDGHGSGSSPTLAVTLEPHSGWSIHT